MRKTVIALALAGVLALPAGARAAHADDRSDNRNQQEKCEDAEHCSDDDFAVKDSVVVICLPESHCSFE